MLHLARVIHIVCGVLWVGTMVFNAVYLGPALAEAGPDAAKVMASLMRRKLFVIMPLIAALTLLSGFWLYWTMVGFEPAFMGTGRGITYGVGAIAALTAFGIGLTVVRPAMMRAMAISATMADKSEAERPSLMATANELRMRGARGGQFVAILLLFATVAMAVGRYV